MQTIYLKHTDEACKLARIAFPEYKGRDFRVEVVDGPMSFESYWDEGNRDYHRLVRLDDMSVMEVQQNGTPYDRQRIADQSIKSGFYVVTHSVRGRTTDYVTIQVRTENMGSLALPSPTELTWEEKVVLIATRSLKSSYAGISNYRFHEARGQTGITQTEYNNAKESLIGKKLLNKAGAITPDGKNAIGRTSLHELRRSLTGNQS